jgi:hypothetical protein
MENGRPAQNSYYTHFYSNGYKQHVESLKNETDVSGWYYVSRQINKERRNNGLGRYCNDDGSIYIGQYKNGWKTEGKKYELQEDQTHTLFEVKYD